MATCRRHNKLEQEPTWSKNGLLRAGNSSHQLDDQPITTGQELALASKHENIVQVSGPMARAGSKVGSLMGGIHARMPDSVTHFTGAVMGASGVAGYGPAASASTAAGVNLGLAAGPVGVGLGMAAGALVGHGIQAGAQAFRESR